MKIDDLSQAAALISATSFASERIVTIVKTWFPNLGTEKTDPTTGIVDPFRDRGRRILVIVLSILSAWFTASFFVEDGIWDLFGTVLINNTGSKLPTFFMGILASGGSTLWQNVLGYTKAIKDVTKLQKENEEVVQNSKIELLSGRVTNDEFFLADQVIKQ